MPVMEIVLHQQQECHNARLVLGIPRTQTKDILPVLPVILGRLLLNIIFANNVMRRPLIQTHLIHNASRVIVEMWIMACVNHYLVNLENTGTIITNAKIVRRAIIAVEMVIKKLVRAELIRSQDREFARLVRMGILRQMWQRHILLVKICPTYA